MKMFYKRYKTTYDFRNFKAIQSFGDSIGNGIITIDMANDKKNNNFKKDLRICQ